MTAKELGIASLFEHQITEKQRFPWIEGSTVALGRLKRSGRACCGGGRGCLGELVLGRIRRGRVDAQSPSGSG